MSARPARARAFRLLIALIAGTLLACAFAPLNWWPLAIVCPAVLMGLWEGASPRHAAALGFWFTVGTFALGTWWLYISIYIVGKAPLWLALGLVAVLISFMALYQALLGYLVARWLPAGALRWLLGTPALWLLIEWWRGWFLSGFPWLSQGYSQTDTWLNGFAPIIGVYGLSALLLLGSGAMVALVRGQGGVRAVALALLLLPWPLGWALQRVQWTHPQGPPLSVALLQGAIPEELKWQAANAQHTQVLYTALNERALGARLIVWPESALEQWANEMPEYLGRLWSRARLHGSDEIMGVIRLSDNNDDAYVSIMTMSDRLTFYDKRHLVPFAEYLPVPAAVRQWLRLRNLPYDSFTAGSEQQSVIAAGGTLLAPTICYEDAYGSAQLGYLARAGVLINVTNDAWFGHSWERYQHFQISRMRALEAQRPLLHAGNDGISAIVGARGEVLGQAPEFQPEVLNGTVQPRTGLPPYARLGNWPVIALALLATCALVGRRLWRRGTEQPGSRSIIQLPKGSE